MENKSIHLWALLQGLNKTVYVQNRKSADLHYLPFRPSSIHTGVPCLPLLPEVGFLSLKVSLFTCTLNSISSCLTKNMEPISFIIISFSCSIGLFPSQYKEVSHLKTSHQTSIDYIYKIIYRLLYRLLLPCQLLIHSCIPPCSKIS